MSRCRNSPSSIILYAGHSWVPAKISNLSEERPEQAAISDTHIHTYTHTHTLSLSKFPNIPYLTQSLIIHRLACILSDGEDTSPMVSVK